MASELLKDAIKEAFKDFIKEAITDEVAREYAAKEAARVMNTKDFLTYKDACEYLSCSYGTLKKLINEDSLPEIRLDGKKLISKSSLKEWLHSREQIQ